MVVACLRRFDRQERDEKALEALKLGVIVIQLASPTLDTQVVRGRRRSAHRTAEKFQQIEQRLNEYATGFFNDVTAVNSYEYFKGGGEEKCFFCILLTCT